MRGALDLAERRGEVVWLADDPSLGPIAAMDSRAAWFERELGLARNGCGCMRSGFWAEALRPVPRRVAQWSRKTARGYCGFLEFVSRLGDGACDAIDLGDAPLVGAAEAGASGAAP